MRKTLVVLGVQGEEELKAWADLFQADKRRLGVFREPDKGGEATALAVEGGAGGDLACVRLL